MAKNKLMLKSKIVWFAPLFLILFSTCKKEQLPQMIFDVYDKGPQKYGSISTLKNGVKWEGSSFTGKFEEGTEFGYSGVKSYTYYDSDYNAPYITESMNFGLLPFKVGRYKLRPFRPFSNVFKEGVSVFHYTYREDDAVVNEFNLIESENNFVEITKIDSVHMEGIFDATCQGEYKINGITHVYRFSEGKFNVQFKK